MFDDAEQADRAFEAAVKLHAGHATAIFNLGNLRLQV